MSELLIGRAVSLSSAGEPRRQRVEFKVEPPLADKEARALIASLAEYIRHLETRLTALEQAAGIELVN